MKKITLILLVFLFIKNDVAAQISDSTKLADSIISAFKSKDFSQCKKLYIDSSNYKELIDIMCKVMHMPEEEKSTFLDSFRLYADSAQLNYKNNFEQIINKGGKLGIDWNKIKKVNLVFDKTTQYPFAEFHINISCNDSSFILFGTEVIHLFSGYKVLSLGTVFKGTTNTYFNSDLLHEEDK
ncbi:hypothetical protein [Ferruginibacter albus]|uniref:hypothetical protein n=1 Tax=Ferruginibacter albus TaxID=2875540 RepID=UPI001CC3371E|nr:hypothetical protein [Ferruginibacter albus]UAY52680.1 hypothetical protein K9M53_03055 [Ferruginibacter albus]